MSGPDPRQTDPPSKIHDDKDQAEAALEELQHFIWRADTSPDKSTLDPNLRRAERHLEDIVEGRNGETEGWPCHCGGEQPQWEYHAENACGDHLHYMHWAADHGIGERFPDLGGQEER